ncbi:recombinase family protein [Amycolatopsis sp. 195334CR]|uniref:recombinase family protein n=1 Tax=Amycolatopsis sp. 195334CR TaxID=2814588 RepID=UPI001F5E1353|nr:recombinase family protein [Amycolatopsis sp. 195334CR]
MLRDEVRVAFIGRTSTEEQQDPRQSLIRQLGNCKTAIPESWVVVAHFYDVESGRMELGSRGKKGNYEKFDIPIARDGGISDLLTEAASVNRRFDVVICESIARIARRAFEGISIERALEQVDVSLFAANEPIAITGSRAQRVLQRRINQGVAEYEVLNTLEQSWGGLCTHVREGWNIGKPCYGYRAKTYRHPNPAKAAKGLTKSRLEPDGVRGETVTQIAMWRFHEGLGYDTIAERLNVDPVKYPPPEPPNKTRARGAWGKTSVYEILRNPKYTGYQVYNRRARRSRSGSKINDPIKWVWSNEPVHEPLIAKPMYDELNARRAAKRGSRDGNAQSAHPAARRTNVLRGMVFCSCGRRMFGDAAHRYVYYKCWPRNNNRGRPDKYEGHPKTVYLREDALLAAITRFFADRVFGEQRRAILAADLAGADDTAHREHEAKRARLERALAEVDRQQQSLLVQARQGDPADPFTQALRGSYNDLAKDKKTKLAELAALDAEAGDGTAPPRPDEQALLDALPYLALNLAAAPHALLRDLFEATSLSLRLQGGGDTVAIEMRLPADDLPQIADTAERITETMASTHHAPDQRGSVDAVRAPGPTRLGSTRIPDPLRLSRFRRSA